MSPYRWSAGPANAPLRKPRRFPAFEPRTIYPKKAFSPLSALKTATRLTTHTGPRLLPDFLTLRDYSRPLSPTQSLSPGQSHEIPNEIGEMRKIFAVATCGFPVGFRSNFSPLLKPLPSKIFNNLGVGQKIVGVHEFLPNNQLE